MKSQAESIVSSPTTFRCVASADAKGPVYVWDLDKTYLQTNFGSTLELIRTAFQKAKDKVAFPGAAPLLRAVRNPPNQPKAPIYFISASPPQMRQIIEEKFAIDGVEVDGIYFKNNLRNLIPGRTARLREQMGYKLLALVDLRKRLPEGLVETAIGDDVETDVHTYTIYSEILQRRLYSHQLVEFLQRYGVFRDEAVRIAWTARKLKAREGIERVLLRMDRNRDPRYYRRFGRNVTGVRNFLQAAALLFASERISVEGVQSVAEDMRSRGMGPKAMMKSLRDLVSRDRISAPTARTIRDAILSEVMG